MAPNRQALVTRAEVAAYLRVPPKTLSMWAYRGIGPKYVVVGRHARYSWNDVDEWLEKQRREQEATA